MPNINKEQADKLTALQEKKLVKLKKERLMAEKDAYYKELKKEKIVEFEIVEDKIVAMGHTILGYVKEGSSLPPRGIMELPPVRYWESNEIPYAISNKLSAMKESIESTLGFISSSTELKMVERTNQKDFIYFEKGENNCYSHLGRIGGAQPIFLSQGCDSKAIAHEVLHALGFIHEHSREDRDKYIDIKWNNIEEEFHNQFALMPDTYMDILQGHEFSFNTIMMYSETAFSKDKKSKTIEALNGGFTPINGVLTEVDIQRINDFY